MIQKILIANRGEIVSRIARTLRKMNITSVAVFSESDAHEPFTRETDEAVLVKDNPLVYLDQETIIDIAKACHCDAIHPGFGFLSENHEFVKNIQDAGLKFIGPSSQAIEKMGNKVNAKAIAKTSGVNTIPGSIQPINHLDEARQIAQSMTYPIMIKASFGGGGKGMRIVHSQDELSKFFDVARSEAERSFHNGNLLIEKYIENPRHIEIQIAADKHGHIVCLGERECSIQRRYQKIIEETPSPFITDQIREKMYQQSIRLAKKIDYYSVGTIEFVVDSDKNFYFLEMNTRLQVEHTITEMVSGLDLVKLMVDIENGEPLPFSQQDVRLSGSAIEARIYAEDCEANFAPTSGFITEYIPYHSKNIRIESGIEAGSAVSHFYDPMIVKLCAHGKDRDDAIRHLKTALENFYIHGDTIKTNLLFLESVMRNTSFQAGEFSTHFLDEYKDHVYHRPPKHIREALGACALFLLLHQKQLQFMESTLLMRDHPPLDFSITQEGENAFSVVCNKKENFALHILEHQEFLLKIKIKNSFFTVKIFEQNTSQNNYELTTCGYSIQTKIYPSQVKEKLVSLTSFLKKRPKTSLPRVTSKISGMIIDIFVQEGQSIEKNEKLLCIESMKMQNTLYSEDACFIKKIHIEKNQAVKKDQTLIDLSFAPKKDEKDRK